MKKTNSSHYIMESSTEGDRLEQKTDPVETERQLKLVGLRAGMKALDAGAGTGAVARVMAKLVGEDGHITAFDASESRLQQGQQRAMEAGLHNMSFKSGDILSPNLPKGQFDFIWCRFVFEYLPNPDAAMKKLTELLVPNGILVVGDLDGNAIFHDGMDRDLEISLHKILYSFRDNFDPYAGRKLYRRFYQLNFKEIQVHCTPHHFYPGRISDFDLENWKEKLEAIREHGIKVLGSVGEYEKFVNALLKFFKQPDTFSYSTLFLVQGKKP